MLFNAIKNIIIYKPKEDKPLEILEGPMEGIEREVTQPGDNNISQGNKEQQPKEAGVTSDSVDNSSKKENVSADSSIQNCAGVVSNSLQDNLQVIRSQFGLPNNSDIIIRELKIARKVNAALVYVENMINSTFVSDYVIRELMSVENFQDHFNSSCPGIITDYISDNVVSAHELTKTSDFSQIILEIVSGLTALFIDGCNQCITISARGLEKRNVDKPMIEGVVYGSQEAFTENMRTNISQVRRIVKNQALRTEIIKIGTRNQAFCAIMYLDGIANPQILNEARRRLKGIDADYVMGSGMVSQFIEDHPYSLFPQVLSTERPDRVSSYIVEGKIAIITEGMPFVDIIPCTFYHLLQASEDSMIRWQYSTFLKIIRLTGFFVSTLLPAIYIALILFHLEAVPTELLNTIAVSKEQVPFPTVVEMLMLELAFELIREGSIRVPGIIGQTLGIVGALILGQAAVAAKLVSPIMIIIVAITGIGSFALPNYPIGFGFRILKFIFIFLAAFMGLYGVFGGIFLLGTVSCSMKSFGVPYFSPVAPKTRSNPDLIFKGPAWKQKIRPDHLNVPDRQRQGNPARKWTNKGKGSGEQ